MKEVNQLSGRFLSLDVFRGLTVCLMIIVNSPGAGADIYPYLSHAPMVWLYACRFGVSHISFCYG